MIAVERVVRGCEGVETRRRQRAVGWWWRGRLAGWQAGLVKGEMSRVCGGVVALFCRVCVCLHKLCVVGWLCGVRKCQVDCGCFCRPTGPSPARNFSPQRPQIAYKLYNTHTHVNSAGLHPSVGITINTPLSVGQSYPPKPATEPKEWRYEWEDGGRDR